jgi:hypothetical protein
MREYHDGQGFKGHVIAPPGSATTAGCKLTAVARAPYTMEVWYTGADNSVRALHWAHAGHDTQCDNNCMSAPTRTYLRELLQYCIYMLRKLWLWCPLEAGTVLSMLGITIKSKAQVWPDLELPASSRGLHHVLTQQSPVQQRPLEGLKLYRTRYSPCNMWLGDISAGFNLVLV